MQETLKIVQIIMAVFAVVYFLFEVYLNVNDVDDDTSNIIIFRWTRKQKLIFLPFAFGAIGGHLFLGTSDPRFQIENGIMPVVYLALICLVLLLVGRFVLSREKDTRKWLMSLLLLLGFAYGHFIWSMNYSTLPASELKAKGCDGDFQYSCKTCKPCK